MVTCRHFQIAAAGGIIAVAMLLIACPRALSQTKLIAYRSHSGEIASFGVGGEDNFGISPERERPIRKRGLPIETIDSVIRLSDTAAIEVSPAGTDTVYRHPYWNNPDIKVDSLRKLFPQITFIGYDNQMMRVERIPEPATGRERASIEAPKRADDGGGRVTLLALLGAIAVPLLGYGIWRTETIRRT